MPGRELTPAELEDEFRELIAITAERNPALRERRTIAQFARLTGMTEQEAAEAYADAEEEEERPVELVRVRGGLL